LQTLLHPEMLGRAFQVLALEKNVGPDASRLAGFKFAKSLMNMRVYHDENSRLGHASGDTLWGEQGPRIC